MNPLLLIDTYKAIHRIQFPKNMIKSVSYFTPRGSRVPIWDKFVFFGLQAFIKKYLIDYFNKEFFLKNRKDVIDEYCHYIKLVLNKDVDGQEIGELWDLQYLPIEIIALEEGTEVPIGVPCFGITNTHTKFSWLPQALESLMSSEIWYPIICATVGHTYREIVNRYYTETCENDVPKSKALSNFDFRGDSCLEEALHAGSAWLLSFQNTSTVPVIPYMERYYNADSNKEIIGMGAISTEHAVMCSNYAIDGDEVTFLKKLLTEIHKNDSFSVVCDSYDYWNVVENLLPSIKSEILNHNGCMLIRGDSGDPVEIVTRTVFKLWDVFGGTVNSKGYKVLNPHIKAIYGDSITVERCEKIFQTLKNAGFSCNNVALGVGSFSTHAIEIDGKLLPFTRDTGNFALKNTYGEFLGPDGSIQKIHIYKDPKTDRETGKGFKKSQKGCCFVYEESGQLLYKDEYNWDDLQNSKNLLQTVFYNGKIIKETNLSTIRNKLNMSF